MTRATCILTLWTVALSAATVATVELKEYRVIQALPYSPATAALVLVVGSEARGVGSGSQVLWWDSGTKDYRGRRGEWENTYRLVVLRPQPGNRWLCMVLDFGYPRVVHDFQKQGSAAPEGWYTQIVHDDGFIPFVARVHRN